MTEYEGDFEATGFSAPFAEAAPPPDIRPRPAPNARPYELASRLRAYWELTKPRITILLLIVAVASFLAAIPGTINPAGLMTTIFAVASLSAGIFALNQYLERHYDGLMRRTAGRPLPAGLLRPVEALAFGLCFTVFAVVFAALAGNLLAGALSLFIAATYLLVYTPLKYRTTFHTALGAVPGAMAPLLGWSIATGRLALEAWILFGILFFWQFPHFLSIEMIHREDYARAGIRVLPVVDKTGRMTALQLLLSLVLLLGLSLLPVAVGLAGVGYLLGALVLGLGFLASGLFAAFGGKKVHARYLLRASVLYLPLLFGLLFLNP